jgi:signal transduction histidine kinase
MFLPRATAVNELGSAEQQILLELAAIDASNFRAAVQRILKLDAQILGVERVNLWIFETEPPSITCEEGYLASEDGYERGTRLLAEDNPRYFEAIHEEQVVAVDDARADPRTSGFAAGYLEPLGITSMMDAPVWLRGSLAGVLCHEHVGRLRRWTARDRELAVYVAQSLARALEARLRSRATFLADATALLTESLDIGAVPQRLAQLTVPMLGDWCVIDVVDGDGLRRLSATHIDPRKRPLFDELVPGRAGALFSTASAASSAAPLLLGEIAEGALEATCGSAEQARVLRQLGAESIMAVPLLAHGRVLGAISVGSGKPGHHYTLDDLEIAVHLTERAAVAIENARLYEELGEALRLRDEFLSVAAHELFTPIQSLQLAIEGLSGDGGQLGESEARRCLAVARRQVRRLRGLVDELLDAGHVRAGRGLALSLEKLDLASVVRDLVEELAAEIARSGSEVVVLAERPVVGRWDRMRIEQVVANLLSNALKFGRGEPISLSVDEVDDLGRVVVHSGGVAIEREQLERIFEPFRRAVSPREYGGLGLGLYIVRKIVAALGGAVWAESSPEEGSTFTVELPREGPREEARP